MPRKGKVLADYLTEDEQAAALGLTVRTLRSWRQRGEGPPFVKVGKRVFYPIAGNAAWLKANEQAPVRSGRAA
jgi:hypothetical protein